MQSFDLGINAAHPSTKNRISFYNFEESLAATGRA